MGNPADNIDQQNVLIVDDSRFVRETLKELINDFDDFQVVGLANNGKEALEVLENSEVDVMTLDLYMPDMDGLTTIEVINERGIDVPILMLSRATTEESSQTTQALGLGAADVLAKPTSSSEKGFKNLRGELHKRLVSLTELNDVNKSFSGVQTTESQALEQKLKKLTPEILVVGGSTGALRVIRSLLEQLPKEFPIPIVIVQHISEPFLSKLPENLAELTSLDTIGVTDRVSIKPGTIYLPGRSDIHVKLRKNKNDTILRPHSGAPVEGAIPSIDELFNSTARALGQDVVALLLSGMGADGARGMTTLHDAGALCMAQDEQSSAVFGMPGSANEFGGVDELVPGDQIPTRILDWIDQTIGLTSEESIEQ